MKHKYLSFKSVFQSICMCL